MKSSLTHLNQSNHPKMVDVGEKKITQRIAIAYGSITMNKEAYEVIMHEKAWDHQSKSSATILSKKGAVIHTAIIAGVMGAKKTSDLIPMCHPIPINSIELEPIFDDQRHTITMQATLKCEGKTGIEMEALTSVSIALLTIYDMLKAIDKSMKIGEIALSYKNGGKSGEYRLMQ